MSMHQIKIKARDVLTFGQSRWPLPMVFHSAVMSSLYRRWPELNEEFEQRHRHNRGEKSDQNFSTSRMRFGGLKTFGPFPADDENIYFPTPLDLLPNGHCLRPDDSAGMNNLPSPLSKLLVNDHRVSKEEAGEWISAAELNNYLSGKKVNKTVSSKEFFTVESRPGIVIDPESFSTVDGKFFNTEYIRLNENKDIFMTAFAEIEAKKYNEANGTDLFKKFFQNDSSVPFLFGGQCGGAYLECERSKSASEGFPFADNSAVSWNNKVKWVLLSPALFNSGWLPGFVKEDTGEVMLKQGDVSRKKHETRKEWRERLNSLKTIDAKLVAAKVGTPLKYSGWKLDKDSDHAGGEPRASRLLVPAGSVYYFECASAADAEALAGSLSGKTKSDLLGEHGLGLGICCPY